jgi:CHAT domain-containing protein
VLLMERFYIDHLGGSSAPAALCQAQIWLRKATARELAERFAIERAKPDEQRRMAYEQASEAWRRFARMRPDERPFANPIYWAAFAFSLAGLLSAAVDVIWYHRSHHPL